MADVTWPNFEITGPLQLSYESCKGPGTIRFTFGIQMKDGPFLPTEHKLSWVGGLTCFRVTCKTANVYNRHINNNKTGNMKKKRKSLKRRVRTTILNFFFFHSVLCWSVAVSTMRRQSRQMQGQCSVGQVRSQVWLGLLNGRFQSGGSLRIPAATARWWSFCGELWAICPMRWKRLSVTRSERGRHPVVAVDFHIRHMASIWYPQDHGLYGTAP